MVHTDQVVLQQNKKNIQGGGQQIQVGHNALGDASDAGVVASQSSSDQSGGTPSPTRSRSASGKWDFTSPMLYYTASTATLLTKLSIRARDASSLADIPSAVV